jgi:hypothetical protein
LRFYQALRWHLGQAGAGWHRGLAGRPHTRRARSLWCGPSTLYKHRHGVPPRRHARAHGLVSDGAGVHGAGPLLG